VSIDDVAVLAFAPVVTPQPPSDSSSVGEGRLCGRQVVTRGEVHPVPALRAVAVREGAGWNRTEGEGGVHARER